MSRRSEGLVLTLRSPPDRRAKDGAFDPYWASAFLRRLAHTPQNKSNLT